MVDPAFGGRVVKGAFLGGVDLDCGREGLDLR